MFQDWKGGAPTGAEWYAVHTRARHEKRVQQDLDCVCGVGSFLPVLRETHQWSDRNKQVEVPLFSCYLFIRGIYSPELRQAVLRSRGVVNFVGAGGHPVPIAEIEIESVRKLLASGMPLLHHPYVTEGQRVRIRGGALDRIEGTLLANDNRKLIISVDMISRSVAVRLEGDGYELEPLRTAAYAVRETAYAQRAWR